MLAVQVAHSFRDAAIENRVCDQGPAAHSTYRAARRECDPMAGANRQEIGQGLKMLHNLRKAISRDAGFDLTGWKRDIVDAF